ncbi:hypothetical protein SAMN04488513_101316 [Pseudozobellia thermophila]|uniref:Uncharacterized protein n=1 Tax=Pseudozobellia thermophila TaxID=192903 RepID=A0A1M6B7R3_9FLAO|nr:hypothetical protein SAMN04488513_101316 [Pseudozobellia thermophila]
MCYRAFLFSISAIGPVIYKQAEPLFLQIEKGGEISALFVPNLTINLTYLCYGSTKILVLWEIKKEILEILGLFSTNGVKKSLNTVKSWDFEK